jgi:hypothetical protein
MKLIVPCGMYFFISAWTICNLHFLLTHSLTLLAFISCRSCQLHKCIILDYECSVCLNNTVYGGGESSVMFTVYCCKYRVIKKSLCTWWLQYKKHTKINVWRLTGDTLNITCDFLYCNHRVQRDVLITLYVSLKQWYMSTSLIPHPRTQSSS